MLLSVRYRVAVLSLISLLLGDFFFTQMIYHSPAMKATISWLSRARLDCYPHGQGFMAATSWKLAGKVKDPWARLMVTILSSMGCLNTSSTRVPNSGNSSRNKTPRCAREISPGCGQFPPPTRPA
jgi:hypothetical protein